MAKIGEVTCDFVHGVIPQRCDEQIERWHTPGINGEGALLCGYKGTPFVLVAVKYDDLENVLIWADDLAVLVGTMADITNDLNQNDTVLIEKVGNAQIVGAIRPGVTNSRGMVQVHCVKTEE
jgi:hypothetical protein